MVKNSSDGRLQRIESHLVRVTPLAMLDHDSGASSVTGDSLELPHTPIQFSSFFHSNASVLSDSKNIVDSVDFEGDLRMIRLKQLKESTSKNIDSNDNSFFASVRPALLVAQFISLIPLTGLSGRNHENIKFKWRHWKVAYTCFIVLSSSFLLVCAIIQCFNDGFSFDGSAPVVFYLSVVLGNLFFLNLARSWGALNAKFAATELLLSDYGYPNGQRIHFKFITAMFFLCAFVEHLLGELKTVIDIITCKKENDTSMDLVRNYIHGHFGQVFNLVGYDMIVGIMLIFVNFIATFCWNFMDLFLGLISIAVSARLRQINKALAEVHGEAKPKRFWRNVREQFNSVSVLTKFIDDKIQRLMLLSIGSNLFFICLQLLKSLKKRINIFHTAYFFWSFGFLIFRTVFVTMCASGIFDESREGRTVLFSVPYSSFCDEVRRFLTQVATDELVLTGCKFFAVTRGLILTIAGTVVTYEIVLVQFKTDGGSENNKTSQCLGPSSNMFS